MREINVSRAGDPVHAVDKLLRGRLPHKGGGGVNRYAYSKLSKVFSVKNKAYISDLNKKKLSFWVMVLFGSPLTPFISNTTRAKSNLVEKYACRKFFKEKN